MRINIVTGPFLPIPPAPCGAVERVWCDLASAFLRRGHDVTILYKAHPDIKAHPQGMKGVAVKGFESTGRTFANLPLDFVYSWRVMRRLPAADVTVTNTFWLPVLARFFRKQSGAIHVHVARVPKGQIRLYHLSGVDRYAAVSSYISECLGDVSAKVGERTRIIPYPIHTDVFNLTGRSGFDDSRKIISYGGRLHPEKGLELLVRAFRLLRDRPGLPGMELRIMGPWRLEDGGGGEKYRSRILKLSEGLPVKLMEPVYNREGFAGFLRESSVFCYPSLAETGESFGVAPLEAMACGVPVVLSDLAVFREFFVPGEHGEVFDHRSPDPDRLLADALEKVIARPEKDLLAMGRECAKRGASFSIASIADQYLKDFSELTGLDP